MQTNRNFYQPEFGEPRKIRAFFSSYFSSRHLTTSENLSQAEKKWRQSGRWRIWSCASLSVTHFSSTLHRIRVNFSCHPSVALLGLLWFTRIPDSDPSDVRRRPPAVIGKFRHGCPRCNRCFTRLRRGLIPLAMSLLLKSLWVGFCFINIIVVVRKLDRCVDLKISENVSIDV